MTVIQYSNNYCLPIIIYNSITIYNNEQKDDSEEIPRTAEQIKGDNKIQGKCIQSCNLMIAKQAD